MEKLFENTTAYNTGIYKEFLEFHNKKYSLKYHLYTLIFVFALIFCMILQFSNSNIGLGIIFTCVLIFFIFYRVFHPLLFIKKEASSNKIKKQMKNTYSFYDNYFKVDNGKDCIKMNYYKLHRVFSTQKYFYLYINKNYSFILDKNNFTIGNAKDFNTFIKKKTWFKI